MSDEDKKRRGARVKELREAFGLTQDQVAERSGGLLQRTYVTRLESGDNAASSVEMQRGLCKAYGISIEDLTPYLKEEITLADLLQRKEARTIPAVRVAPVPPMQTNERPLRYPRMRPALDVGRDIGFEEQFLAEFAAEGHDLDEDASSEIWIGVMKAAHRRWVKLWVDIDFAKSEDAKAEKFTAEKEAELVPKMPGKTPHKSPLKKPKK